MQEEVLKFHLVHEYKPTLNNFSQKRYFNSVLINKKHIEIFTNWISQRAIGRYSFRLLYRASKDGSTTAAFHAKCDNKGATIVIAKIRNKYLEVIIHFFGIQVIHISPLVIALYFHLQIEITFRLQK